MISMGAVMPSLEPSDSRILLAGDWHGNFPWASSVLRVAEGETDTIIQLGDFGYWEHESDGKYFLDRLSSNAVRRGVNIVWLDGNHENHTMLREKYAGAERSVEGFWKIRDNIWYSPRANVWEWFGKRLMTVGGAFSIDRQFRALGKSFWAEEIITPEEEALAISRGKVDILFTHDAPTTYPAQLWKADLDSQASRQTVSRIADAVRPTRWFHGHYHSRHSYSYPAVDPFARVLGLAEDGTTSNLIFMDLLAP